MKVRNIFSVVVLLSAFLLSGCVVRTYKVTRDRVDQNLTGGNRGYLMGSAPSNIDAKERKSKRSTHVVEIEMRSPVKFEKTQEPNQAMQSESLETPAAFNEPKAVEPKVFKPVIPQETIAVEGSLQKYTVQKGDTLQKISEKFFGTTKKWTKIYDVNREVLKGPNTIYPGQVINVPVYSGQQPQENLK